MELMKTTQKTEITANSTEKVQTISSNNITFAEPDWIFNIICNFFFLNPNFNMESIKKPKKQKKHLNY